LINAATIPDVAEIAAAVTLAIAAMVAESMGCPFAVMAK
jgi:hypothetical protein